jgi:hypothetical protein
MSHSDRATFAPYPEVSHEVTMSLQAPMIERLSANGVVLADPDKAGSPAISFDFEPAAPMDFLDWMLHDTVGLMTVCYQDRAHVSERYVVHDGTVLRVYSPPAHRPIRRPKTHRSMVLRAATIEPAVLFPGWWEVTSKHYPLPQILAGKFYSRRAYLEHHVIAAVAVLEAVYEQIGLPAERMDATVFRARSKWHRDHEENHAFKELLGEQLSNRQTLRIKMDKLGTYVGDELLNHAGVVRPEWITHVMAVRNKLAHSGSHVSGVGENAAIALEEADRETRAVLTLLLCRLVGASDAALRQAAFALHPRPFTIPRDRPGSDLIDYE